MAERSLGLLHSLSYLASRDVNRSLVTLRVRSWNMDVALEAKLNASFGVPARRQMLWLGRCARDPIKMAGWEGVPLRPSLFLLVMVLFTVPLSAGARGRRPGREGSRVSRRQAPTIQPLLITGDTPPFSAGTDNVTGPPTRTEFPFEAVSPHATSSPDSLYVVAHQSAGQYSHYCGPDSLPIDGNLHQPSTASNKIKYRVVLVENKPFIIKTRSENNKTVYDHNKPFIIKTRSENNKTVYDGFCMDILKGLAEELRFDYTLYEVPDGNFGLPTRNGSWDGMIREVIDGRADFTLGPLTISSQREAAVDFTKPYMDYGNGLVMKKPAAERPNLFAFLLPFQITVWMSIIAALFAVGPNERGKCDISDRSKCSSYHYEHWAIKAQGQPGPSGMKLEDSLRFLLWATSRIRYTLGVGDLENDNDNNFTLKNSLWFSYWSIVRKGGEPAPRAIHTRLLGGFWWLFSLIVMATYTANLTAFLTVKRLETPIRSLEDLVHQSTVEFGTVRGNFLYNFFREQKGSENVFDRIWYALETQPDMLVDNQTEGVERTRRGNYAYIVFGNSINDKPKGPVGVTPSYGEGSRVKRLFQEHNTRQVRTEVLSRREYPALEYEVRHDEGCQLMMVGNPFMTRGYGIATKRGSSLSKTLSVGILRLQEKGKITQLREKWWNNRGCSLFGRPPKTGAEGLGLDTFFGVFVVLIAGAVLACLVSVLEILYYKCCKRKSMMTGMTTELEKLMVDTEADELMTGTTTELEKLMVDTEADKLARTTLKCLEEGSLQLVIRKAGENHLVGNSVPVSISRESLHLKENDKID
ncbi:Glutamate receptor ionotropic, delta-1 [Branchiostoma belcheri]|nr:Glutamate receptor ionotropic, delta-1 [Branchiostoma belcheri]